MAGIQSRVFALASVVAALIVSSTAQLPLAAQETSEYPVFAVDSGWPQKLPYHWIMGHVPSVAVDSRDHVFVLSRPNTLEPDVRARSAPPVVEFDSAGKFVNAWGGPGIPGFDWPDSEHGITVDYRNNVWVGGSAPVAPSLRTLNDDMLLKFTRNGEFLLQIGGRDRSPTSQHPPQQGGNRDTKSFHQPTDVFVYAQTNEAFISDGYGNRRVIVLDADTGAFKRMWGAFGNEPIDVLTPLARPGAAGSPALDTEGEGSPQFGSPVHAVKVSNDGLVYVADRPNRRVQVFTVDGRYVRQMFLNRAGPSSASAAGLAFSADRAQRFLYVADYGNSHIAVVDRKSMTVLYQFGQRSAAPGNFQGLHNLAVDSKGNLYTGEVAPGARLQKFVYKGISKTLPPNALTAAQVAAAP
jgi:hypothetical protein